MKGIRPIKESIIEINIMINIDFIFFNFFSLIKFATDITNIGLAINSISTYNIDINNPIEEQI